MLKGQDIIILTLLRLRAEQSWTYEALSGATGLSTSQCHLAQKRLRASGLLGPDPSMPWHVPAAGFLEFLLHGFRYVFPARTGAVSRGIPTAHSAPFVARHFAADSGSSGALIWPHPEGSLRGNSLEPIHSCQLRFAPLPGSSPSAADRKVYELLVCLDLLRIGRARERAWAAEFIRNRVQDAG